MEENHSYKQVIGPAKYQTALAGRCGLASNDYAITYPSLPNYVALTSGTVPSNIAGRDCTPSGGCVTDRPSIFTQSGSWKVYAESMPTPCSRQNTPDGLYVPRHTAAPTSPGWWRVRRRTCRWARRRRERCTMISPSGALPRFALIAPNTTDDAHGGCLTCADNWLARWMPAIINSRAYQSGSTAVFITYDSDNGGSQNHVATIVVAPAVPKGTVVETRFTHYSLLRTEEDILGIAGHLGGAATAPSMAAGFHLAVALYAEAIDEIRGALAQQVELVGAEVDVAVCHEQRSAVLLALLGLDQQLLLVEAPGDELVVEQVAHLVVGDRSGDPHPEALVEIGSMWRTLWSW